LPWGMTDGGFGGVGLRGLGLLGFGVGSAGGTRRGASGGVRRSDDRRATIDRREISADRGAHLVRVGGFVHRDLLLRGVERHDLRDVARPVLKLLRARHDGDGGVTTRGRASDRRTMERRTTISSSRALRFASLARGRRRRRRDEGGDGRRRRGESRARFLGGWRVHRALRCARRTSGGAHEFLR
jgi:hypothetical protein